MPFRVVGGHVSSSGRSAAYLAEHARLMPQREELKRAAERYGPTTNLPLDSLMDGWRTGDPRTQRGLLGGVLR